MLPATCVRNDFEASRDWRQRGHEHGALPIELPSLALSLRDPTWRIVSPSFCVFHDCAVVSIAGLAPSTRRASQ